MQFLRHPARLLPLPLLALPLLMLLLAGSTVAALRAEEPPSAPAPAPDADEEVPDAPEVHEAPADPRPAPAEPWDDPGVLFERRFVDGRTGQPVPGVRVRLYSEVPHPQPGLRAPQASATSGPDGVARIRREQLDPGLHAIYGGPHMAVAEAPGFACMGEHARLWFGDWLLQPAERVCLTVVDELDRPVEDALVCWVLGCGHCSDVRQARTDAEGRACFEEVGRSEQVFDPDLWIVKSGYAALLVTLIPEPDEPIRLPRARVLEGVVLDAQGQPVADAAVGVRYHHRGPWTRTDAQGGFALVGVPEDDPTLSLLVEREEYPIDTNDPLCALSQDLPARDRPLLLRLPPAGAPTRVEGDAEAAGASAPPSSPVSIEVRLGPAVASLAGHDPALYGEVIVMRRADGFTVRGEIGREGRAELSLPPGLYDVVARAWPEDATTELPCAEQRGEVLVAAGQPARFQLVLPAPRRVHLSLPEGAGVLEAWLHTAGRGARLVLPEGEPSVVWVPAEGAVAVTLADEHGRHTFPLDPSRSETVELRLPRRTVSVTLLDAAGRSVRGWLRARPKSEALEEDPSYAFPAGPDKAEQLPGEPSVTPSLSLRIDERVSLVAWPEEASGCEPVVLPSLTIQAAALALDLGPVRLPPRAPALTIFGPDGAPLRNAEVELRHEARRSTFYLPGDASPQGGLADDWRAPGLIVPGALVRVVWWREPPQQEESVFCVPFEARLDGPGPWTMAPPRGGLKIEILAEARPEFPMLTLTVDDRLPSTHVHGPLVRVLGLTPGAHDVVLRGEGYVGRRLRTTLADSEMRRWTARLRLR